MRTPDRDVLTHYAAHYSPGMTDLSSSSPVSGACPEGMLGLDYPVPGGTRQLREAIANLYPGCTCDNIVVTNGASEALAATAFALLQRGDTVVAAAGSYPSFTRVSERLGVNVEIGDNARDGATALLVNNPTVPFGQLLPLDAAIAHAERHDTRVIADEVYLDLTRDSPAKPAAVLSPRAISIGDLSKPLGLGGLRIGWIASHDRAALDRISAAVQVLSGGPGTPSMALALDAVLEYETRFQARAQFACSNGELVKRLLCEFGWDFEPPEMGWTFFARPPSEVALGALGRLHSEGLFLVPGETLGAPGGFRLSLFAAPAALRKALELLAEPAQYRADPTLVVLAKAPDAGLSKTRLAASIGDEAAQSLAEAFLEDTLAVANSVGVNTVIAYTPSGARATFEFLAPGAELVTQPEGDLGERLLGALRIALREGGRTVLIGTDTPHLPPTVIGQAFAELHHADIVLGPAEDGGFYLIGVRGHQPALFTGVEWSTCAVLEQVLANAREAGLSVSCLETVTDIDDIESLRRAEPAIERSPTAKSTRRALARLKAGAVRGA